MTTYKDKKVDFNKKVDFDKKVNVTSYFVLFLIGFAYLLGSTVTFYPSLSILFLPPNLIPFIGLFGTIFLSKLCLKEIIDYFMSQEIDEVVQKINDKENEDFKSVLSPYEKNIFDSIGLEYFSLLYKAFGSSWNDLEPFRLSSRTWQDKSLTITPKIVSDFEENNKVCSEAVQLLLNANGHQGESGYTILNFMSKKSVQIKYNNKLTRSLSFEEMEDLYALVLATLSAWLICSIKYQVKIPPAELLGKYKGNRQDYIAALTFIKETALKDFFYNKELNGMTFKASNEVQNVISDYLEYLIKFKRIKN